MQQPKLRIMDQKSKKEYTNGEVTIVWQSGKCTHSANCVKNNPDVLNQRTTLITPDIQPQKNY